MALETVKEAWASHYEEMPKTIQDKDVEIAVRWILKGGPWTQNNQRRALFASFGIGPGTHLLHAGSGIGKSGISEALRSGCQVTLLDYSRRILESAQKVIERLSEGRPVLISRIRIVQGALEDSGIETRSDFTFNEGVLEHWFEDSERIEMIRQMARLTRAGGKVIIFVPNERNRLYKSWLERLSKLQPTVPPERAFTSEELKRDMEEAGLDEVYVKGFAPHLSFVSYDGSRPLALAVWFFQRFLPRAQFNSYADRYGFFLVGVGTRKELV